MRPRHTLIALDRGARGLGSREKPTSERLFRLEKVCGADRSLRRTFLSASNPSSSAADGSHSAIFRFPRQAQSSRYFRATRHNNFFSKGATTSHQMQRIASCRASTDLVPPRPLLQAQGLSSARSLSAPGVQQSQNLMQGLPKGQDAMPRQILADTVPSRSVGGCEETRQT